MPVVYFKHFMVHVPCTVFVSPPWSYCSKNLRRLWSTFTLSQESITEEMTFAHAPRATSSRNCRVISSLQVVRSNSQPPRPSSIAYQSRIPTPLSSPRPNRARHVGQSTPASCNTINRHNALDSNGNKQANHAYPTSMKDRAANNLQPVNGGRCSRILRDKQVVSKGLVSSPRALSCHREGGSGKDFLDLAPE